MWLTTLSILIIQNDQCTSELRDYLESLTDSVFGYIQTALSLNTIFSKE